MIEAGADLATMGVAGGLGFLFRQFADSRRQTFELAKAAVEVHKDSADAAASRPGGTYMRRAIYGIVAFCFVASVIAGFVGVPVVVETVVQKGGFLWGLIPSKDVVEYVTIQGVPMFASILSTFQTLGAFYLGQGVK